ncbi:uncharacterized protein LOC117298278 isoform X2 [Asterias rubens]|uniref:uncharacterized protein LOC117298278 isoform X2 n=1 Tax=Asterias rubens TaxID=7604 RepID=UPI00145559B5|nr:uncharacterized protein LOC117298278 isoform X2 [Asterias rubens]
MMCQAVRTMLILVCIQLGVKANDPSGNDPNQDTGQGHAAGETTNQKTTGVDDDGILSQKLTWVSVCLIVPSAVGLIVMVGSCCLFCYRRLNQTDSFSPTTDPDPHLNDDVHQTKDDGYSGPNPMAFWHGTLATLSGTTSPNPSGCNPNGCKNPTGCPSKEEPEPIQYLDLMLEPRSYETIPTHRDVEMTSYAQMQGEIRPSASRRFSFFPFKHI